VSCKVFQKAAKPVNFSGVVEMDDNVEFGQTAACAGGSM
jgi:hypothetical protein